MCARVIVKEIHMFTILGLILGSSDRYWCLSRGLINESYIENEVKIKTEVAGYEVTIPNHIEANFEYNSTHVKCQSDDSISMEELFVNTTAMLNTTTLNTWMPCMTNIGVLFNFLYYEGVFGNKNYL